MAGRLRLLVAAGAIALAACQVNVEGARCVAREDCPAGQACGNDGRCSVRAAACEASASRCAPGASRCAATAGVVERCTDADAVCGRWEPSACDPGLVCDPATFACVCGDPDGAFDVDPGATADGALAPTGAAEPRACRFRLLGDGVAAATAYVAGHPGHPATVRVVGTPASGAPVAIDVADTIELPTGVTLTSGGPSSPEDWVVRWAAAAGASPVAKDLLVLHDGAAVEGFTLDGSSVSGAGIRLESCATATPARIRSVRVDGRGALGVGVSVKGTCALEATGLAVANTNGTGILVDAEPAMPDSTPVGTTIVGGSVEGNASNGVEVRSGVVSIKGDTAGPFAIARNGGYGAYATVRAAGTANPITFALEQLEVFENSNAGVHLQSMPLGSSASIVATSMHENRAGTASVYGAGRVAGGVLLEGAGVPLAFRANRVYANEGDQVGIYTSSAMTTWNLTGAATVPDVCASDGNVFACPAAAGYLMYSTGATVAAAGNFWAEDPPTGPPPLVNTAISYKASCGDTAGLVSFPACPQTP